MQLKSAGGEGGREGDCGGLWGMQAVVPISGFYYPSLPRFEFPHAEQNEH